MTRAWALAALLSCGCTFEVGDEPPPTQPEEETFDTRLEEAREREERERAR